MKKKPMSINVILNGIRTVLSLIFPLITFPYVNRVLLPEGVGRANFAASIANYFVLLGALGITAYAIREGAKYSEDRKRFENFADQMWTLGILAGGFAYLCLAVILPLTAKLQDYRWLIVIYSLQILANALGMEWVLNVYEEYAYVTVRSFLFQVLSLLLLFIFVKSPADVYRYVVIQTISTAGIGITNHIYVRHKLRLRFVCSKEIFGHMRPILMIFSITLATTIYLNLDTSMLGFIWGDEQVGYYTAAAKLYHIIKALINSIVTVYAVRLSSQYYQNRKEYQETFKEVMQILTALTIPIAAGGYLLREEIIVILGGRAYLEATASLVLLLLSLIPATMGNLFSSGALLIVKEEKSMFAATLTGTVINTILNYILIHKLQCTGAAAATLLTEIVVCTILVGRASSCIQRMRITGHIGKVLLASALFFPIAALVGSLGLSLMGKLVTEIAACVLAYAGCLLLLKDELVLGLVRELKKRR